MIFKKYSLVLACLFFVAIAAGLGIWVKMSLPKIGFVDNNALYKEFKGKADLEKEYMKEKNREQSYMDSLYIGLTAEQKMLGASSTKDVKRQRDFLDKKSAFEELSNRFEARNKEIQSKYLEQIWSQINQYVKEYGKENNYDYILGATGNGTMMHASEKNDITKDVLKYINKRYDGK